LLGQSVPRRIQMTKMKRGSDRLIIDPTRVLWEINLEITRAIRSAATNPPAAAVSSIKLAARSRSLRPRAQTEQSRVCSNDFLFVLAPPPSRNSLPRWAPGTGARGDHSAAATRGFTAVHGKINRPPARQSQGIRAGQRSPNATDAAGQRIAPSSSLIDW